MMAEPSLGTIAFDQITYNSRSTKSAGKMKFAIAGVGWKEAATGLVTTIKAEDFVEAMWMRLMKGYRLRLVLVNGAWFEFDGFKEDDLSKVQSFIEDNYNHVVFKRREGSLKGWNWGHLSLEGTEEKKHLTMAIGGKTAFEYPLSEVSNAVAAGKNELMIEIAQPEQLDKKTDCLMEIRLQYIPGGEGGSGGRGETGKFADTDAIPDEDALIKDEEGEEEDEAEQISYVQALCDQIKASSPLTSLSSDVIVSLQDLPCLVPRGRFDLDMTDKQLRLHGKTYDHKIAYSSIIKLFLLPRQDDVHVLFVVALDPPLRQGQTRYPFLVFNFAKDLSTETELRETIDDDTLKTRYEGRLERRQVGDTFEVISRLFRVLTGQKIVIPGAFKNAAGASMIKCSIKANEGHLYPLERSLLFLPKPVILVQHQEITRVEFQRIGSGIGNPRTFDLQIVVGTTEHTFSNINKEEAQYLEEFLMAKQIPFTKDNGSASTRKYLVDSESEEEEYSSEEDEEEESGEDGKRRKKKSRVADEDYVAESESSVAEEYNEDYSGDESDDNDEGEEEEEEGSQASSQEDGDDKGSESEEVAEP